MIELREIFENAKVFEDWKQLKVDDLIQQYPDIFYCDDRSEYFTTVGYKGRCTMEDFRFLKNGVFNSLTTKFICNWKDEDIPYYPTESIIADYRYFTEMNAKDWTEYSSRLGIVPKQFFINDDENFYYVSYYNDNPDRKWGVEFAIAPEQDRLLWISIAFTRQ